MNEISLCLSGGGIRAVVFHMGVLKYLAEVGFLEKITKVSSVSGGSILVGLILHENNMEWPSSEEYINKVFPKLRDKLCNNSVIWDAIKYFLKNPGEIKLLIYRANWLSKTFQKMWGISEKISELPESPECSFNGTTAENGKRFRLKKENCGDYELGYASSNNFLLADAMAMSAAFPGGIGPFIVKSYDMQWHKRSRFTDNKQSEKNISLPYKEIHIYDGGVYDNLGIEPFYDLGEQRLKDGNKCILISDAGAPLERGFSLWNLNPWRFKRVADIMQEQIRSLRIRSVCNFLEKNPKNGAYFWIKDDVKNIEEDKDRMQAISYPTTLGQISGKMFDHIARHGYTVACTYLTN